jgi:hypothetical protein
MRRFNNAFRVVILRIKFEFKEGAKNAAWMLNNV